MLKHQKVLLRSSQQCHIRSSVLLKYKINISHTLSLHFHILVKCTLAGGEDPASFLAVTFATTLPLLLKKAISVRLTGMDQLFGGKVTAGASARFSSGLQRKTSYCVSLPWLCLRVRG